MVDCVKVVDAVPMVVNRLLRAPSKASALALSCAAGETGAACTTGAVERADAGAAVVGAARFAWVGGALGFSFGALTTTSGSWVCATATVAKPNAIIRAEPRSR